ncbi:glycosyltransferase [Ferruginibacter lapsinanis]|uniref:glycosyltransferase n=1 Tax=Ferruginibacter lapsinanis TaxID=563172 RepID=UPI001E3131C9|nr:glycosyltransferase [Ferruginibacter lapsinanis]UEG48722.1 glycosyltransferase [Ferruginibacter lapsinanis]
MDKHLHIITHDIPYPADFGGVIDLFYKIKTLHQLGIKIHLHCFQNKRPQQEELNKYCASVNYYQRTKRISFRLPFIVSSRQSPELIERLSKDTYPVLIEGIHCSYPLYNNQFTNRKVLLRLHNAEFEYYHHLAIHEKNIFRKIYFTVESYLLKKYENAVSAKAAISAVSQQDVTLYKQLFGITNIEYLPVFLPYTTVTGQPGKGHYCLYHGNLSISENEEAAIWLLQNVFNTLEIPFVIAGKDPSQKLEFLAHEHKHTCLVANPSDKELQDMIAKAQINILPSFNNTGVKLKLLNALYNGRHCLVNKAGVEGSGLEKLCAVADDAVSMKQAITELYNTPFSESGHRLTLLEQLHNNEKNAAKIIDFFWS